MILVTGASGFLGQHLVRHLSTQGKQVRALYNSHAPTPELQKLTGITWLQCDLLDVFAVEEAMLDVQEVYHCAAVVSFDARLHDKMLHFNPESTVNIVNQAILQGIRKLVYVSSVAAIGRPADAKKEINEDTEWEDSRYNSAYALSKFLAEMEVWRGIGEGLNAVIVNPGIILGPTEDADNLSNQMMKIVYREFPFYTKGVASWVAVADVVKAMAMLMDADIGAERFIISSGNFSYREVFTLMAKELGKKPPRYAANRFMGGLAWRLGAMRKMITGANNMITKESAATANILSYYNNQKLLTALPSFGYSPLELSIAAMARSFEHSLIRK